MTANPLSFKAFAPLDNTPHDATGSISVHCVGVSTALDSFTIKLGAGQYGGFAARQMRSGVNPLNYNIYKDAGYAQIWGDGTGGYAPLIVDNQLSLLIWNINVPVYGRLPSAPTTKAGSYTDSVVVTVEW